MCYNTDEPLTHYIKGNKPVTREYYMITPNEVLGVVKYIGTESRMVRVGDGEEVFNGYRASVEEDENFWR